MAEQLRLPPTAAQPAQAAGEAGQDVAAGHAAPPGYNPGVEHLRRSEFKRLQGRVYAGGRSHEGTMRHNITEGLSVLTSLQTCLPSLKQRTQLHLQPDHHGPQTHCRLCGCCALLRAAAGRGAAGAQVHARCLPVHAGLSASSRPQAVTLQYLSTLHHPPAHLHPLHPLHPLRPFRSSSLHGNPHSEAGWAPDNRSAAADAARLATLRWCNADPEHYCCIFTAGATGV